MYLTCKKCGNDTFKITSDMRAECTKCGATYEICFKPSPKPPEPPEPLPPSKPGIIWFR
ncbi:hypothetical protein [Archaeoglobus veneficus]|uniref:Viral late gene transcription factor 3 zinc ribbon domain-containing protein n=1 Tax=Archaeoglobus veneficus (strain DSM 11195 / SNP6) TaxID=693661 RepID=F2KNT0_ARCVS|nr:hypothetical protein [Archaeoglobus veneficus]AEA47407.1 hypothetical protein Arcve_1403 [Archaeoglobus veneficus SNP6]